jgi:hypothetical protein
VSPVHPPDLLSTPPPPPPPPQANSTHCQLERAGFTRMCMDCGILDDGVNHETRRGQRNLVNLGWLDSMFAMVNFEEDKTTKEAEVRAPQQPVSRLLYAMHSNRATLSPST